MKLTKKKALELTAQQWRAVGKTEETALSNLKFTWPKDNGYGNIQAECFLCEYDMQINKGAGCEGCPLLNKWDGEETCSTIGSPYITWWQAYKAKDGKAAQAAALRIAEICAAELKLLGGK